MNENVKEMITKRVQLPQEKINGKRDLPHPSPCLGAEKDVRDLTEAADVQHGIVPENRVVIHKSGIQYVAVEDEASTEHQTVY